MKKIISTDAAPAAVGPYSQAVAFGNLLFCAGMLPLDPKSGELVRGGVAEQADQICRNIKAVLAANQMTVADVVKSTVFLTNMADFAAMNEVYAKYFTQPFVPARSTVAVAGLPKGAQVEIEVIAAKA